MRTLLLAVLAWSSVAFAKDPVPAPVADLSGTYAAKGANPGGAGGYEGTVALTRSGDVYSLAWTLGNSPPYKGVALQVGNTLGVGWGMGAAFGVVVYKISGGSLKGTWATASSGPKPGTEEIEGPATLNGKFKITKGQGPDGRPYTGDVTITPNGEVYDVTWTLPKESYNGTAIKQGDLLIVGWGAAGKGAGVVSYTVGPKGLDGKWGGPGNPKVGTETLAKK